MRGCWQQLHYNGQQIYLLPIYEAVREHHGRVVVADEFVRHAADQRRVKAMRERQCLCQLRQHRHAHRAVDTLVLVLVAHPERRRTCAR